MHPLRYLLYGECNLLKKIKIGVFVEVAENISGSYGRSFLDEVPLRMKKRRPLYKWFCGVKHNKPGWSAWHALWTWLIFLFSQEGKHRNEPMEGRTFLGPTTWVISDQ